MYLNKNTKFTDLFNGMVEEMLNTINTYTNNTPNYGHNRLTNNFPANTEYNDVYGKTTVEKGTDNNGNTWVKTTYTSNDGAYTYTTKQTTGTWDTTNDWPTPTNWGSNYNYNTTAGRSYTDRLETLKEELNRAVTEQKYEEAARLKKELDYALRTDSEYANLQKELETVVKAHNYERAIEVRDRIREYENKYAYTHNTNNPYPTTTGTVDRTTTNSTTTNSTTTNTTTSKKGK